MDAKHNASLVPLARNLRKNMTKEERRLWYDFLRNHDGRFTRQKILGKYIVDFYSARAKLVIELDGSQHYENDVQQHDRERTEYLEQYGLTVLRFANNEISRNFDGICEFIDYQVKQRLNLLG